MSLRVQVVLSDNVGRQLRELAAGADIPPSTLAAQLVANEISRAIKNGHVPRARFTPTTIGSGGGERPPWLEPYGGDREWRRQMWGAVVALYGRYPEELEPLKDKWWTRDSDTEVLCALAVWRAQLDEGDHDAREEMDFHNQLLDYSDRLRRRGGGVTKAWRPGGLPAEWAGE